MEKLCCASSGVHQAFVRWWKWGENTSPGAWKLHSRILDRQAPFEDVELEPSGTQQTNLMFLWWTQSLTRKSLMCSFSCLQVSLISPTSSRFLFLKVFQFLASRCCFFFVSVFPSCITEDDEIVYWFQYGWNIDAHSSIISLLWWLHFTGEDNPVTGFLREDIESLYERMKNGEFVGKLIREQFFCKNVSIAEACTSNMFGIYVSSRKKTRVCSALRMLSRTSQKYVSRNLKVTVNQKTHKSTSCKA